MKKSTKGGDIRRDAMIAATTDSQIASDYLKRAEDLLARQKNLSREKVRPVVAGKLTVSRSVLDLIRRQRRKNIPSWLKESIVSLFIEIAQTELQAIEHEIEVARQIGLGSADQRLVKARARAKALFAVLENITGEGAP